MPETIGKTPGLLRLFVGLIVSSLTLSVYPGGVTVLYRDRIIELKQTLPDPVNLWITPEDLTQVTGFVLKSEGACLAEICIPIRQDDGSDMVVTRSGKKWFNFSGFSKNLKQVYVADRESATWSFGEMPLHREGFLQNASAPDFEMEDRNGKTVKLSDYRGKKVLLITWASW